MIFNVSSTKLAITTTASIPTTKSGEIGVIKIPQRARTDDATTLPNVTAITKRLGIKDQKCSRTRVIYIVA